MLKNVVTIYSFQLKNFVSAFLTSQKLLLADTFQNVSAFSAIVFSYTTSCIFICLYCVRVWFLVYTVFRNGNRRTCSKTIDCVVNAFAVKPSATQKYCFLSAKLDTQVIQIWHC